jgi:hypothetical protein
MQRSGSMAFFQKDKPVFSNAPQFFLQISKTSKLPLFVQIHDGPSAHLHVAVSHFSVVKFRTLLLSVLFYCRIF